MADCILKQGDTYLCFNHKYTQVTKKVYFASEASLIPLTHLDTLVATLKLKGIVVIQGAELKDLREVDARLAKSLNLS